MKIIASKTRYIVSFIGVSEADIDFKRGILKTKRGEISFREATFKEKLIGLVFYYVVLLFVSIFSYGVITDIKGLLSMVIGIISGFVGVYSKSIFRFILSVSILAVAIILGLNYVFYFTYGVLMGIGFYIIFLFSKAYITYDNVLFVVDNR